MYCATTKSKRGSAAPSEVYSQQKDRSSQQKELYAQGATVGEKRPWLAGKKLTGQLPRGRWPAAKNPAQLGVLLRLERGDGRLFLSSGLSSSRTWKLGISWVLPPPPIDRCTTEPLGGLGGNRVTCGYIAFATERSDECPRSRARWRNGARQSITARPLSARRHRQQQRRRGTLEAARPTRQRRPGRVVLAWSHPFARL